MARKNSAVVLVVCVVILAALSILAVSFARQATLQQSIAVNYVFTLDAQLSAMSGIDHAKALLLCEIRQNGYVKDFGIYHPHPPGEENYDIQTASHDPKNAIFSLDHNSAGISLTQQEDIDNQSKVIGKYIFSGAVGPVKENSILGRYTVNGNNYALKIVNLASKLNVNSHVHRIAAPVIDPENPEETPVDPIDPATQQRANSVISKLLESLAIQCGIPQPTAGQIANALRNRNTADFKIYRSMEEVKNKLKNLPVNQKFLDNLCVHSWIDSKTMVVTENTLVNAPKYQIEERAPIDVNTASLELLTALIENTASTVTFIANSTNSSDDFVNFVRPEDGLGKTATEIIPIQRQVTIKFSADVAKKIAEAIKDSDRKFFNRNSFDDFLQNKEDLKKEVLPVYPENLPVGLFEEDWFQACRDTLKSNFNPNTIENFWNPNKPIYRMVTKADLFEGDPSDPRHTTELCFFSQGRFEISSIGRLMSAKHTVISQTEACTIESLYQILRHTTQNDFHSSESDFQGTISYPERPESLEKNAFSGYLEPEPVIEPQPENLKVLCQGNFSLNPESQPEKNLGILDPENPISRCASRNLKLMQRKTDIRDPENNFALDGLLSRTIQYSNATEHRYYAVESIKNTVNIDNNDGKFKVRGRYQNRFQRDKAKKAQKEEGVVLDHNIDDRANSITRVANYRGTIEMWVKLDVDGQSSVECGLLSIVQTGVERHSRIFNDMELGKPGEFVEPHESIKYTEGTQTVLFKNSDGNLRLSRIYFCGFFDKTETPPVINGKTSPYTQDVDYYGSKYRDDGDPIRKFARRDVIVECDWQAHTWHHIIIAWDDTNGENQGEQGLILSVDGKEHTANYILGPRSNTAKPQFCILSETDQQDRSIAKPKNELRENTMDGFFLNGIQKNQPNPKLLDSEKNATVFRHSSNVSFVGNATIDGVISYAGIKAYNTIKNKDRDRFPESAFFTNTFRAPEEIIVVNEDGTLKSKATWGAIRWTAYSSDTGNSSPSVTCTAKVIQDDSSEISFLEEVENDVIVLNQDIGILKSEVQYTLNFSTPNQESELGRVCAAVDSVEIVIIAPSTIEFKLK